MKNFIEAMNQDRRNFLYLKQIRKLMKDAEFHDMLNKVELRAWRAFKIVDTNFLENARAEHYKDIVSGLVNVYKEMGSNMSLKIHFSQKIWVSK